MFDSQIGLTQEGFSYTDSFGRRITSYVGGELLANQTASLRYVASPETIKLMYGSTILTYSDVDRTATSPYRRYGKGGTNLAIGWPDPLRYVTAASFQPPIEQKILSGNSGESSIITTAIFGFTSTSTALIDGPKYFFGRTILAGGTPETALYAGQSLLQVRSGTGGIIGMIHLSATENGNQVPKGSLAFSGTLDNSTNLFSGTLSDPQTGFTGTFKGALYGPGREEIGLAFRFSRPLDGGTSYSGLILAGRQ